MSEYTQKDNQGNSVGIVATRQHITAEPPAEHVSNNDYAANFTAFLDARPEGEPFCFWYGALEPHRAYEYGVGVSQGGRQPADVDVLFVEAVERELCAHRVGHRDGD